MLLALLGSLIVVPASVAAQPKLRPLAVPIQLSAPRSLGLRQRRVCPQGPCQAIALVRPNGSADVTNLSQPFWLTPLLVHFIYQLPDDSVA